MPAKTIKVFNSLDELSIQVINLLIELSLDALDQRGKFSIVFSGGSTPNRLFMLLSQTKYANQIDWAKTHIFWADERCVPPDQPGSNYFQARETLLKYIPVPGNNINRIQGELEPAVAASAYAQMLKIYEPPRKWPRFDLVLLGMGEDGHTASIFPGSDPDPDTDAAALPVTANYQGRPANRVTLTPAVLNDARQIIFMVSGEKKAKILNTVINGHLDPRHYPAQRIQPSEGSLTWLVDNAAAKVLLQKSSQDITFIQPNQKV